MLALGAVAGLTGCPVTDPVPTVPAVPLYPAAIAGWPPAPIRGELGRGALVAAPMPEPVTAGPGVRGPMLSIRTLTTVPGPGPARAIASGLFADHLVIELIDVDAGVVRWRDAARCSAPPVLVTATEVVCADATHAIGLAIADGAERWRKPAELTGAQGGLLLARGAMPAPSPPARPPARPGRPASPPAAVPATVPPGQVASIRILAAATGDELAQGPLPSGVGADEPRAACRTTAGYDVWAWTAGALRRIAIEPTGARVAWQLGVAAPRAVDLGDGDRCDDTIVVGVPDGDGELVYALDRVTGAPRAAPVAAFGHWRARQGDGLELATAAGIEHRDRQLGAPTLIADARVADLVASRGDQRLVRTRGARLALIDGHGAVTTLGAPVGVGLAVLGDRAILSGPWHGVRTFADDLRRFARPLPYDPGRDAPLWSPPAIDDADLADHLDLPPVREVRDADAVPLPGVGARVVGGVVVDPDDPAQLYAVALEDIPSATVGAGLAGFDLRTRRWRWHRADGCPPGTPSSIAIASAAILCAAEVEVGQRGAVRATGRGDGAPLWEWTGRSVSQVDAAGGVVAIVSGGRVFVLDAATGAELDRFMTDDGWAPRVAVMKVGAATLVVAAERGAVVARLAGGLPLWAVRTRGLVTGLALAGDRLAVSLDSGELYLLDPRTGRGDPVGGLATRWQAPGGGDAIIVQAQDGARREWRLTGYSTDGIRRFRTALMIEPGWQLSAARGRVAGAALPLAWGPALRNAALVEPRTGAILGLFALPERAVGGLVFATIVDGAPVSGVVLSQPLAVVTF